jgi:hypothetical protein
MFPSPDGTDKVLLAVRETERTAQRELLSVLRLVDAGKVAVSDKTRRASPATIDANAGPIRAFAAVNPSPLRSPSESDSRSSARGCKLRSSIRSARFRCGGFDCSIRASRRAGRATLAGDFV